MSISALRKMEVECDLPPQETLAERISRRQARVVVIGAGYVGLTLAVGAAHSGFSATCFEVDAAKVEALRRGCAQVPGVDPEAVERLRQAGELDFTGDIACLRQAEVIVICVPTPLNKQREPDTSYITQASSSIGEQLQPGTLVILESTTFPGTTAELVKPLLEASGLKAEQDFWLAYSPERVDPGNDRFGLWNTPKIVAGLSPQSTALAKAFYAQFVEKVVEMSSPAAAEMVKLYENIFRNINIAFANEMALLCDRIGLNIWEIIAAAATKPYGFMPFYPGPGPGGHCIPVDPYYLSWKARQYDFHCQFIELASNINDKMPRHVCTKVAESLNLAGKPMKDSHILLLGVAYKPDVGDVRESSALRLIPLLKKQGAKVSYHDPHVPTLRLSNPGLLQSVPLTPETLQEPDCVILLTDHSCYPYEEIAAHAQLVVDCKNALAKRRLADRAWVVSL